MSGCLCELCGRVAMAPELPALLPLPDRTRDWRCDCHWLSPLINGVAVLIRRGFVTDGASIPRVAWRAVGHPFSKELLPHALPHDALYAAELFGTHAECDDWMLASMAKADESFARGVGPVRRMAVWAAVRTFGVFAWARHTAERVEKARKLARLVGPEEYRVFCDYQVVAEGRVKGDAHE